jgi:two-component system, cell cycle sensor histidine kinase and response regulator CckA
MPAATHTSDHELIARAVIGIARLTLDGRFVSANSALLRMLGYRNLDELSAVTFPALFSDPAAHAALMRVLQAEHDVVADHVEWVGRDGARIVVRLSARQIGHDGNASDFVALYVEDLTAHLTLEDQLHQAQKLENVGRLVGGVAHDFANILTAILGYSEKMLDEIGPDKPISRDLLEIRKAAERARGLIRQLLAFSRKDRRQRTLFDANQIVRETQVMLRQLLGEDIDIQLNLAEDLPPILADRIQLEQVLINLAVNARDAMPRGGELQFETASVDAGESATPMAVSMLPGRYVRLRVRDTGTGMDAATQAHIFDPFFTTKPAGHGTGLGLATVYGIAKDLGGYIAVDSELHRGTTFTILLPAAVAGDEAAAAASPFTSVRALAQGDEVILLVEDDAEVRKLAGITLRRHGYTVLEAALALDGLRLAAHIPGTIHLVLSDIIMPGLSGPELVERLRHTRPETKVLYMTGYPSEARQERGISLRGDAVLEKPFTPDMLLAQIRAVLGTSQPTDGTDRPPVAS